MPNITLSEARAKALRTRRAAYDIRDPKLKGFGVRVLPSGAKRLFIHSQHRGQRTWKTVGDANTMALDEARTRADSILAAIRIGDDAPMATHAPCFETVAEAVFQRHAHIWKAKTLYSESLLLPMPAPSLVRRAVNCRHRSPGRATLVRLASGYARCRRPLQPILSVILREAELMGYRPEGSNPCRGIRRYRRKGRERYLTDEEIRRLAARLSANESERPLQVAAVRLLLLTGCRRSEVLTLRWSATRPRRRRWACICI